MNSPARGRVLIALLLVTFLTYVDRINVAALAPDIMRAFQWDKTTFGFVMASFTAGYALMMLPFGWLADHFGPRRTLVVAIVVWSGATAACAWAGDSGFAAPIIAFGLTRAFVGIGEAASLPCSNGLVRAFFPEEERGRASGALYAGVSLGAALSFPLVAAIAAATSWRASFVVVGAFGIVIAFAVARLVPERPARPSEASDDARLFTRPHTYVMALGYACMSFGVMVLISMFKLYLVDKPEVGGLALGDSSTFVAMLPFLAMFAGAPLGGVISDRWLPRFGALGARRRLASQALLVSALCFAFAAQATSAVPALLFVVLAFGSLSVASGSYFAACMVLSPTRAATFTAVLGVAGNIGGIVAQTTSGAMSDRLGWGAVWLLTAIVTLLASGLWLLVRTPKIAEELRAAA